MGEEFRGKPMRPEYDLYRYKPEVKCLLYRECSLEITKRYSEERKWGC